MNLTNVGDRSQAYMLKKINYALETIIILHHTLFWSPDNDAKYVPKSQRPNHYAWLTHRIKQVTDDISEWEAITLRRYSPTTDTWHQKTKTQISRRLRLAPRKHSRELLENQRPPR